MKEGLYMVKLNRDITVLLHMKKYTEEITMLNLADTSYNEFVDNYVLRNSISMDLMQIGELANHLSQEYFEETKNKMNWGAIKGIRNHFVHGYFSMDYKIIFDTAINDIPEFQRKLNEEIKRLNS